MTPDQTANRVELETGGMRCAACVASVEAALRGVPGVADASVNPATEHAAVTPEPGHAPLDPTTLVQAVRGVGYEAQLLDSTAGPPDQRGVRRAI